MIHSIFTRFQEVLVTSRPFSCEMTSVIFHDLVTVKRIFCNRDGLKMFLYTSKCLYWTMHYESIQCSLNLKSNCSWCIINAHDDVTWVIISALMNLILALKHLGWRENATLWELWELQDLQQRGQHKQSSLVAGTGVMSDVRMDACMSGISIAH